jgi:hypothetical protein
MPGAAQAHTKPQAHPMGNTSKHSLVRWPGTAACCLDYDDANTLAPGLQNQTREQTQACAAQG